MSSSDGVTGRGGMNSFPALYHFLTRGLRIDWSGKVPLMEMFLSQLLRRGGGGVREGGRDGKDGGGGVCMCVCVREGGLFLSQRWDKCMFVE